MDGINQGRGLGGDLVMDYHTFLALVGLAIVVPALLALAALAVIA